MSEPDPIDFTKIIAQIEARGLSLYKIALMMHRQYTQVKRWKDGKKEPRFHEGQMLLMIHREIVPHETLQGVTIPMTQT